MGSRMKRRSLPNQNIRYDPKLWQERTAYSQYLQPEAIGTRMRRWEPSHPPSFLSPLPPRGVVERVADVPIITRGRGERRRDLDTLTEACWATCENLEMEQPADPERRGRYAQPVEEAPAVGANLFGSAGYVASYAPWSLPPQPHV